MIIVNRFSPIFLSVIMETCSVFIGLIMFKAFFELKDI